MAKALHFVAGIDANGAIQAVYAGQDGAAAEAAYEQAIEGGQFALVQLHHGASPTRSRELADVEWPGHVVHHDPAEDPDPPSAESESDHPVPRHKQRRG